MMNNQHIKDDIYKNNMKDMGIKYLFYLLLNISITLIVIIFLLGLSISSFSIYQIKSRLSSVLTNIPIWRLQAGSTYTQTGRWPESYVIEDRKENFGVIKKVIFDGKGTINIFFNNNYPQLTNKVLSFSASEIPNIETGNIIWNCGYAELPNYFISMGDNMTNIQHKYLPSSCK